MEGSRYKEMKTINSNITALPEPTEYHFFIGSDTLALSSGSAIFKSKLSGVQMEFNGSARISRHSLTFKSNRESGEIGRRIACGLKIGLKSQRLSYGLKAIVKSNACCFLCYPSETNMSSDYKLRCTQAVGSKPTSPYLKITRPKQFPVVSQKWSMEKLTTSSQKFLHCPNLTTGNLDGKQNTNLKKMSHAIMEPDS